MLKTTLFIPLGLVLFAWVANWILWGLYSDEEAYDEHRTIHTEGGCELDLWRYKPEQPNDCPPVMLVHGLTANHRNLAFDEQYGLAQYLNRQGYDCWAIDLRGRDQFWASGEPWCFDDYLDHDLPRAVDYILEETESEQLHWVGHSMGGMLLLAYAGTRTDTDKLASGTTIGSPAFLEEPWFLRRFAAGFLNLPQTIYSVFRPILHFIFAGLLYSIPWRIWLFLLVEQRFSRDVLRLVSNVIVTRVNYRVPLQFLKWLGTGEWISQEGEVDYREGLGDVDVPTFMLVGQRDELCPDRETSGFDLLGCTDKKFRNAAQENGYRYTYDHISLVFSSGAREELFPEIENWIRDHS